MSFDANGIRKTNIVPKDGPGKAAFVVKRSDGRLYVARGAQVTEEPLATTAVKVTTASVTLTAKDDGCTVIVDTTDNCTVTLPATAAGLKFTVIVKQAGASGKLHKLSPVAADKFIGNGFTAADAKACQNTQATAAVGDSVSIVGDGVDGWLFTNVAGTWARES
jgi:hypothetical protein